ncbi:hypothetical protein AGR5A_pa50021 [Agrobacterium genomosp. 5 str. CFBP 6626]|nr:hypothetical protein AGR5A_pa50021 [Agrobacterium genomosp. 5 str. CFBP 6626]
MRIITAFKLDRYHGQALFEGFEEKLQLQLIESAIGGRVLFDFVAEEGMGRHRPADKSILVGWLYGDGICIDARIDN